VIRTRSQQHDRAEKVSRDKAVPGDPAGSGRYLYSRRYLNALSREIESQSRTTTQSSIGAKLRNARAITDSGIDIMLYVRSPFAMAIETFQAGRRNSRLSIRIESFPFNPLLGKSPVALRQLDVSTCSSNLADLLFILSYISNFYLSSEQCFHITLAPTKI